MTMRIGRCGVVALLLGASLTLAACDGSSSGDGKRPAAVAEASASPSAPRDFDVEQALASANSNPYSAEIKRVTRFDTIGLAVVDGRLNLPGKATGTLTVRIYDSPISKASRSRVVLTRTHTYVKVEEGENAGGWKKGGRQTGSPLPDLHGYAELLLAQGPSARKGIDGAADGVPAQKLSGEIPVGKLEKIDPSLYKMARQIGLESFACDVWVDDKGRVLKLVQWAGHSSGGSVTVQTDLSDLDDPVEVEPPTGN
ncbi:LppX_LprAFG lipoprotein [Streptomyces sp. NPDC051940]|uniref:LppX_LprAFG lipoprotein n=1 Tax=Streptomyces sp. NPDC051940 TaxID=3155675 RepID=UPI00341C5124